MEKPPATRSEKLKHWNAEHTLDFLFANALPATTGSLAVVLTLAFSLSFQPVSSRALIVWTVIGVIIACVRLSLGWGYSSRRTSCSPQFWLNSYRIIIFASGLLIGFGVWLFFENVSAAHQHLILFTVLGLTAAAIATHAVDQITFYCFLYPSCALTALRLLSFGEATYYALSFMLLLYVLVMGRAGRQTHSTLQQNFQLTHAMHYRATHDVLVSLLNRQEFENQFELLVQKTRHGVAMLFIDLDNFKELNDTLGHQAGDEALTQVSKVIKKCVRADDVSARLGGDEFVVFLLIDDVKEVERIANNILHNIGAITFPGEHTYEGLSASIGIAFHPNNKVVFSQLMRTADMACYKSKEMGKNQINISPVDQVVM